MSGGKWLKRVCPVCSSRRGVALHRQSFLAPSELAAPPNYEVVACTICGFCFADVAFDQAVVDAAYEAYSKYIPKSEPVEMAVPAPPPEAQFERERFSEVAAYLAASGINRSSRVLDAGCATGGFLAALRAEGFTDVCGIDPSPEAVSTARRAYGVRAVAGSFMAPPSDLARFDLVTLSHTLEHMADLRDAMRSLRVLLADGGLVYAEVPDASRYAEYLVAPFQDFNTEHINHFSLPVLERLMAEHGFVEVDAGSKLIACGPGIPYPAIYGLWRKSSARGETYVMRRDNDLPAALERYVLESNELLQTVSAGLERDLGGDGEACVWGTGQLAMKLLGSTVLSRKRIRLFVDQSPTRQGMHIGDAIIGSPRDLKLLPQLPIVVASVHQQDSILRSMRECLGSTCRAVLLDRPDWLEYLSRSDGVSAS